MRRSRSGFSSLRVRLALLVLAAALPGILLIVYDYAAQRRQAVAGAYEDALRVAHTVAASQNQLVESTRDLLAAMALHPVVRSLNPAACSELARNLLGPVHTNIGVATPDGNVFCSAVPTAGRVNIADRAYFRRAVQTREFAVGEFQVGRITSRPALNVGYPLLDGTGRVSAVAYAGLDLSQIGEALAGLELPQGSATTVLDANATVLARHPDGQRWVGRRVPETPVFRAIQAARGEGTAQVTGLDGTRRLFGFVTLPISRGSTPIYISVGIPVEVAFGPAAARLGRYTAGLAAATLFMLLLAWLTANSLILRPVGRLIVAAERLSRGDLSARTGMANRGELGRLGQAFDEMAEAVQTQQVQRLASEARKTAVLESALDAVITMDHEGRVLEFNPAAERIFGYGRDQAIGREMAGLIIPPALRDQHRAGLARYLATGEGTVLGRRLELTGLRADGSEFPIELSIVRIPAEPPVFTGFVRDITDRKRAEAEIRLRAAHLEALNAIIATGAAAEGVADAIEFAVRRSCEALQVASGAAWLPDLSVTHRLPSEFAPALVEATPPDWIRDGVPQIVIEDWEDVTTDGPPASFRPVMQRFGIRATLTAPIFVNAKQVGTIGVAAPAPRAWQQHEVEFLDAVAREIGSIVGRKRAEQRIREGEERFRLVVAAVSDAIWDWNIATDRVWWSEGINKLYGHAADETGESSDWWDSLIHPEDREGVLADLQDALEGDRRTWAAEYRVRRADGTYVHVLDQGTIVRDDRGRPRRMVGAVVDLTDRRQSEQDRLARDAAEVANRAKSEFLSRMSHELRTPLNAILGFGQLLEMDVTAPDHRESVEQILKAGRHLLELINEVLDIARIEAGRLAISLEPVPVDHAVGETLDLVRPLAAQRGLRLSHSPIGNEVHVMADRQRLKQVLLNLLSNAVKFTPEGGDVRVACAVRDERVRIDVADTGPGIPAADRQKLFAPFERLRAGQTGIEGTGLGLALSKGLIEAMGGGIGVDSRPDAGSTFWVELTAAAPPTERVTAAPIAAPSAGERDPRTVLYIEDNISNLKLIERVMARRPDVRLITAMQGTLGLELAREHRPDLILLDMHLPDITGDVILRRLKQDPVTQRIPVVMVTATAQPGQIERLLAAGAAAYLTKPVDVYALFKLLDDLPTSKDSRRA